MKEELYGLANHIAGAKGGLPQEWQEWADEIEMDIRKLANREAQPVPAGKFAGWGLYHAGRDDFGSWLKRHPEDDSGDAITKHGYVNVKLFTAPPAPAVSDGYCVMPLTLTAANGAKGALSGEFKVSRTVRCHECGGEGCDDCGDAGEFEEETTVPWDTIKEIYRAAVLNHVGDTNEKAVEKCECSSIDYCDNCLRAMLDQPVNSGYKLVPVDFLTTASRLIDLCRTYSILSDGGNYKERTISECESTMEVIDGLLAAAPEGGNGA